MAILALSGPIFMGGVIAAAGLLLWLLLRAETRDEAGSPGEEPEEL